jgi:hypothetical protein
MTTITDSKLKLLTKLFEHTKILTTRELERQGFSQDLIQWYRKSGWIKNLGRGAYCFQDSTCSLYDAVSAVNSQTDFRLHFGGKSALREFYGISHFSLMKDSAKELFIDSENKKLPSWFTDNFADEVLLRQTDFLKSDNDIEDVEYQQKVLKVSSKERCFLELLYSVPKMTTSVEAKEILELLPTLRPKMLQSLLENCSSVKVKRLFFYLSQKVNHFWLKYLDKDKIDLGSGVREIEKGGTFIKEFEIVIKDGEI